MQQSSVGLHKFISIGRGGGGVNEGSFRIWVDVNDTLMRHLLLTKIFKKTNSSLCRARFLLVFTTYTRTRYVHTQSRALEEIQVATKGNEQTPKVLVRIPHPKINI